MKLAKMAVLISAALAITASTSAYAQIDNSAFITNYGYKLIDLDLNDGITPTFTVTAANSHGIADPCLCGVLVGNSYSTTNPLYVSTGSGYGDTRVNTGGNSSGYFLYAQASTGSFSTRTETVLNFSLSANTKLVFFGTSSAAWGRGAADTGSNLVGNSVTLSSGTTPGSLTTVDSYSHILTSAPLAPWGSYYAAYNENFNVAYSNTGSSNFAGTLDILVQSNATITSVPEPTTYAMLMAGLLVAGVAARRRRG
jgi:hypothetical protein